MYGTDQYFLAQTKINAVNYLQQQLILVCAVPGNKGVILVHRSYYFDTFKNRNLIKFAYDS